MYCGDLFFGNGAICSWLLLSMFPGKFSMDRMNNNRLSLVPRPSSPAKSPLSILTFPPTRHNILLICTCIKLCYRTLPYSSTQKCVGASSLSSRDHAQWRACARGELPRGAPCLYAAYESPLCRLARNNDAKSRAKAN
jgi:hypothetical protein